MKRSLLPPFALLSLVHSGYSHYYICFCLAFCSTSRISSAPLPVIHISHPWFINEWTLVLGLSQLLADHALCANILPQSKSLQNRSQKTSIFLHCIWCNVTKRDQRLLYSTLCPMLLSFLLRLLRLEEQKIKATKLGNSSLDSLLCHPPKLKNSIHPPFKKLNELPAGWNVSTSSWLWRKNAEWIRGTGKGTVQSL